MPVPGGYQQVLQYVNDGSAWYDGLQVRMTKQLTRRVSLLGTYTWSHDINTVEWDGTQPEPELLQLPCHLREGDQPAQPDQPCFRERHLQSALGFHALRMDGGRLRVPL